jgi:hypothetical protein
VVSLRTDPAASLPAKTLEKIVGLQLLTAEEIEAIQNAIAGSCPFPFELVFAVTGLDDRGDAYVLHIQRLGNRKVRIVLDWPAIAVMRTFGLEGALRSIIDTLRKAPYENAVEGATVIGMQLIPPLTELRSEWIRVAARMLEQG